ncbi:MAG: hypothetical protein ACKPKO_16250, partial [Candidatus Fonsibacter sp.]
MNATFQGDIRAPLLTLEAMEEIERKAIEYIEGVAASHASTSPPTVQKPPGFVVAEKLRTLSGQELLVRSLQYGQVGTSSLRASVATTVLKVIKDRLKWRPYPMRRSGDTEEGGDLYTMEK